MVVDRSDYARYYNLARDDGVSFYGPAKGGQQGRASSMKKSYIAAIGAVRSVLGKERVMLMNSLGYSSLSLMEGHACDRIDGLTLTLRPWLTGIDGTFSEGRAVNAVGLLGAGGMVSILWTPHAGNETEMDLYFQVCDIGMPPRESM